MKKMYFTPDVSIDMMNSTDVLTASGGGLAYTPSHDGDEKSWSDVFGKN